MNIEMAMVTAVAPVRPGSWRRGRVERGLWLVTVTPLKVIFPPLGSEAMLILLAVKEQSVSCVSSTD